MLKPFCGVAIILNLALIALHLRNHRRLTIEVAALGFSSGIILCLIWELSYDKILTMAGLLAISVGIATALLLLPKKGLPGSGNPSSGGTDA
jgi:hypothetical protein